MINLGLGLYFQGVGDNFWNLCMSSSFMAKTASEYIMRVQDTPRRKHVLSRARDRLTEMVEDYKPNPVIVPGSA